VRLTAALVALLASAAWGADAPGDVTPPTAQCPLKPEYPPELRASGRAGTVALRVDLDGSGKATDLLVTHGMGEPYDAAALAAARACTFTAGKRGTEAVPSAVEMTIEFTPPPRPGRLIGEVVGELSEPRAGVEVTSGSQKTSTDAQGRFDLEVDATQGDVWVVLSLPGYRDEAVEEHLGPGDARHVRYALHKEKIHEVVVVGSHMLPPPPAVDPTPQVSHFSISRADIDRTPGAMEDVARVVQDLPGVAADPDLLATFYVRGGGPEEIVYYLDGVPLSNPFHLGGFVTIFNPMLISGADFFAGGAPARYEPALSGVLDVSYVTGESTRPHVEADVSLLTAKIRAESPTPIDGLSVMVAARRSYFELYFDGLAKLGVVAQSYVAPDITDVTVRADYRRGRQEITATYLQSSDGLSFVTSPGETSLVNIAAGLNLYNRLQLGSVRDRISLGGSSELTLLAAVTRDLNHISVATDTFYGSDSNQVELLGRADLLIAKTERNRLQVGTQYSHRTLSFIGQATDARDVAPWSAEPFVDTGAPNLTINPFLSRNIFAAYIDDTFHPIRPLELSAGARVELDAQTLQTTYSFQAAASYELKTHTVLKGSLGLVTQETEDPLLTDPTYGNPNLLPQRSLNAVVGFEQPLPFQTLVRVEGYGKWLDHLAVNPDTLPGLQQLLQTQSPVFQSIGTGFARGVDVLILGRTRRWSYGASYGWLVAERTNPLAEINQTYAPPWDQRNTAAGHVSFIPAAHWLLSGRISFHSGRPVTPVLSFVRDDSLQKYLPVFGPTDSARYPAFYEASVRAQREFRAGPIQMTVYLEVLNVTDAQNVFATVYSGGDYASGMPPVASNFYHLPIRPFLGVSGEY
jgi:TonB family protein